MGENQTFDFLKSLRSAWPMIGAALLLALIITQFPLHYLESWTYDWRSRLKPTRPSSKLIDLIMVQPSTLSQLKGDDRLPEHSRLLEGLDKSGPLAIVYTFDPTDLKHSDEEAEEFLAVTKSMKTPVYFASFTSPPKGQKELPPLERPFELIKPVAAPIGSDITLFAKDGVSRRFIYSIDDNLSLHAQLAQQIQSQHSSGSLPRGLFSLLDVVQGYIHFLPSGSYPSYEFLEAMEQSHSLSDPEQFAGKILLIGDDSLRSSRFYLSTPLSRDITAMTLAEVHANALDTLILDRALRQSPRWFNLLVTTTISLMTLMLLFYARPAQGLALLGLMVGVFVLLALGAFALFDLWIPMSQPLLAVFVCYYFFVPYRLIMENRRSWEYYQRNRLLTQVEELKSNFMRMMSHDLKTPLARIQGMADLVLQEGQSSLNQEQKSALESIHHSSEELADFISSILNLGRIESKEVKLQLRSRDINSLLKEVIGKCDYLAQQKNIRIIQEFEPLFSMKMDEDLMRQVFTNLLENAIKYSPPNTRILVSTEEVDGQAVVQIADQGYGMSPEDLANAFTKFYRSRQATSSSVKGSGLGLFLAKYFVDLHQGRISVESQLNQGSTFYIELPMNLTDSQTPEEELR